MYNQKYFRDKIVLHAHKYVQYTSMVGLNCQIKPTIMVLFMGTLK